MAFWTKNDSFEGDEFPIDRSVERQMTESLSFTIRDSGTTEYPDYSKATMNNKGELYVSSYTTGEVCRNKKELKKFISWLILAYKDIFDDRGGNLGI